jgi:hypothetical protein
MMVCAEVFHRPGRAGLEKFFIQAGGARADALQRGRRPAPVPRCPPAVFLFMHTRLLSFLSDIEQALAADDPAPAGGAWDAARTVNYHLGLARLMLHVRPAEGGKVEPRGTILLQSYQLADGSPCLKAALSWHGSAANVMRAIYAKPDVNWTGEARKVAAEWLAGPPAQSTAEAAPAAEAAEPLAEAAAAG